MAVTKPTFTTPVEATDLLFDALQLTAPGDKVFYGFGSYTDEAAAASALAGTAAVGTLETTATKTYEVLGELAEKGFTFDGKQEKNKTRNYVVPGKQSTTVEVILQGLGFSQVTYLRSSAFAGKIVTIVIASKDLKNLVVLNGVVCTVDVKGETDGNWSVTVGTEFAGALDDKVFIFKSGASTRGE